MYLYVLITLLFSSSTFRIDYVAEHRLDNFNTDDKQYAIDYYDPISFYDNEPRVGLTSISFQYNGVIYTFIDETNKEKFLVNFKDLEPRFGGWCAYSMTQGKKVNFEPEYYAIIKDSLYLFSTEEYKNTFKNDFEKLQKKAWVEWAKILPTFDPRDSIFRMK